MMKPQRDRRKDRRIVVAEMTEISEDAKCTAEATSIICRRISSDGSGSVSACHCPIETHGSIDIIESLDVTLFCPRRVDN
jgi:hypothetical protein